MSDITTRNTIFQTPEYAICSTSHAWPKHFHKNTLTKDQLQAFRSIPLSKNESANARTRGELWLWQVPNTWKKEVSAVSPWTLLYVLQIIRILPIRLSPETPLLVPAHRTPYRNNGRAIRHPTGCNGSSYSQDNEFHQSYCTYALKIAWHFGQR